MTSSKASSFIKAVSAIFEKGKSLIARVLFIIHGIITVWRVTDIYSDPLFFLLCIPMILMIAEFIVTTYCTKGEWKWFCPSVFLYLLSVVPGLWLLQFDVYNTRQEYKNAHNLEECGYETVNKTSLQNVKGVSIPIELSSDEWALALEQIMLILLIAGRWLLPKGKLTRDQLSQLLLVYIGIAADSLEFSLESLKEQAVICNLALITIILAIWSWSLIQFCLVMTAVAAPKPRVATGKRERTFCKGCVENEIWALMMSVILQDAPFLIMRLYLIINFNVINQMMLFFTCKNIMVVLLQFYRMVILLVGEEDQHKPLTNGGGDIPAVIVEMSEETATAAMVTKQTNLNEDKME